MDTNLAAGWLQSSVNLLTSLFWGGLALILVLAGLRLRARLRQLSGRGALLDEAAIRRIQVTGRMEIDDELDMVVIEEEERRFLAEEEWE